MYSSVGVVNVGGKVEKVATGYSYTCAILDTGGVKCWGENNHGQLGYGNTDTIGDDEPPAFVGYVRVRE